MASKVYVRPARKRSGVPRECRCPSPGYTLSVGYYVRGKFRLNHQTCSKCMHICVWDDRFDDVVCDRCGPHARAAIPLMFANKKPDLASCLLALEQEIARLEDKINAED